MMFASLTHQGAGPQYRLFPRAAATAKKASHINLAGPFSSIM